MPERQLQEAVRGKSRSVKSLTRMIDFKALLAEFHTDLVDRRPACSWRYQLRISLQSLLLGKYMCFIKCRQSRGGNWLPPDNSHAELPASLLAQLVLLTIPVFVSCDLSHEGSQKHTHSSPSGVDLLRVIYQLSEVSSS